jgi:hypothetical protein
MKHIWGNATSLGNLVRGSFFLAVGLALALSGPAPGEPPTAKGPKAPTQGKQVRRDRYGDPLPPGAIARLGTVRLRHSSGITGLAFSPDAKFLASSGHNSVRLWETATGK